MEEGGLFLGCLGYFPGSIQNLSFSVFDCLSELFLFLD